MSRPGISRKGKQFWFYTRAGDGYTIPSKRAAFRAIEDAWENGTVRSEDFLSLFVQVLCLADLPDQEVSSLSSFEIDSDEEFIERVFASEAWNTTDKVQAKDRAEVHDLVGRIIGF